MITPFHDKEGKLHFPYKPLRDIAFIYPSPPPKKLGKDQIIELPEEFRKFHQDKTGIVLSIGPGYYDRKNRFNPSDPKLTPGTMVYFDNTVPWAVYVLGLDMHPHKVVVCGEADILGLVE